jgi:hypothetical protein
MYSTCHYFFVLLRIGYFFRLWICATRLHFSQDISNLFLSVNTEENHCNQDGRETGQCLKYDKVPLMSAATRFIFSDMLLFLHFLYHK